MRLTLFVFMVFVLSGQSLFAKDALTLVNCQHTDTMKINIRGGTLSAGQLSLNGQNLDLSALPQVQYLDPETQDIRIGEEVQLCRDDKLTYALTLWGAGSPHVEFYFGQPVDGGTKHYHRTQLNLDIRGYDTNGDTPVRPIQ